MGVRSYYRLCKMNLHFHSCFKEMVFGGAVSRDLVCDLALETMACAQLLSVELETPSDLSTKELLSAYIANILSLQSRIISAFALFEDKTHAAVDALSFFADSSLEDAVTKANFVSLQLAG